MIVNAFIKKKNKGLKGSYAFCYLTKENGWFDLFWLVLFDVMKTYLITNIITTNDKCFMAQSTVIVLVRVTEGIVDEESEV